jgi:hypothetical protein
LGCDLSGRQFRLATVKVKDRKCVGGDLPTFFCAGCDAFALPLRRTHVWGVTLIAFFNVHKA